MRRFRKLLSIFCILTMTMQLFTVSAAENNSDDDLILIGTKEEFLKFMEELEEEMSYGIVYDTVAVAGGIVRNAMPPTGESSSLMMAESGTGGRYTDDYSTTNLQVQGVDEADLIKTDGKYIYYIQSGIFYIVETDSDGNMELVHSEVFENFVPSEMYLDNDSLIIIGYRIIAKGTTTPSRSFTYTPNYIIEEYLSVHVYDIANRATPKKIREASMEGSYLSSRKIGDSLYLVSNKILYQYNKLPVYRDSTISTTDITVPFDKMYIMPDSYRRSMIFVMTIDLSDNDKPADLQSFIGSADLMYMSHDALYLGSTVYTWNAGWINERQTKLYKFDLESDKVKYAARGRVNGYAINQFSMDEHNGYLRIATTDNTANNLYILDNEMNKISEITDIAPGERVYSVRFLGDRGYVVTFKQTDPLFAFDLSDPKNPKLLGALKIPGYSTYLHPYDENHLIGFGEDTEELKGGGVIATGLKMSMFDVTDMTNPKELFVAYIGDRGSTSPLLTNHKAILQSTERDIFAFPAYEYKKAEGYENNSYTTLNQQGAFIYSIDMDEGFQLRGVITHKSEEEILKAASYYSSTSMTDVARIIYIGDVFYTISSDRIQSNKIDSLDLIDSVLSLR